jgi:hypothetical protein
MRCAERALAVIATSHCDCRDGAREVEYDEYGENLSHVLDGALVGQQCE